MLINQNKDKESFSSDELKQAELIFNRYVVAQPAEMLKIIHLINALIDVKKSKVQTQANLQQQELEIDALGNLIEKPQKTAGEQKNRKKVTVTEPMNISIPNNTRVISNVTVRAALFAAIKGDNRQFFKRKLICSQSDIKMVFTGEQFNQDDYDIFMELIFQHGAGYSTRPKRLNSGTMFSTTSQSKRCDGVNTPSRFCTNPTYAAIVWTR
jgi:hypothetical protein